MLDPSPTSEATARTPCIASRDSRRRAGTALQPHLDPAPVSRNHLGVSEPPIAASLTGVVVGPERIAASLGGAGHPWRIEAVLAGERLVGIVHDAGNDFPIVLRRAPR